jgi:aryl sulfotransferase
VNFIHEKFERPKSVQEVFQSRIFVNSETSFFAHVRSWWDVRHLPNVLLVHFCGLKSDLRFEIKRVAKFLEVEIEALDLDTIIEHCSFDYMKENALNFMENKHFIGGAKTFFCKGTNERWKDLLTKEESQSYEKRAIEELGVEGARWLATGDLPGDTQADG